MRRLVLLIGALFMIASCASPISAPSNLVSETSLDAQTGAATPSKGSYAYATLAEKGSVEWTLAPLYTRNAMLRQTAARRLKDGRLSKEFAQTIYNQTQAAHERLRDARIFAGRADVFEARVAQVKSLQDSAQELLEGGKR